jgi:hypothetical protein
MTLKDFTHDLRRGLGSAIIELKKKPEREKYRGIVMRSCLKDIAYDTQVEGTKGFYLYAAIKTFGPCDDFLNNIIAQFNKKLYWRLSEQLFDILCCFSNDKNEMASAALEKKYADLKNRLPLMRDYNLGYCGREQFEHLMVRKLDGGFDSFKQCVNDMGEMITKRGKDDCLWYDWFLTSAESKFGKDIYAYMEQAENRNVAVFFQMYKKTKSDENRLNEKTVNLDVFVQGYTPEQNAPPEKIITIDHIINRIHELAQSERPNPFRISSFARKFAKQVEKKELETLARIALEESSVFTKTALLCTFRFVDFPLDIGFLIPYALSGDESICNVAVEALSRLTDERIHALALQLFNNNHVENALELLKSNFKIEDEPLMRKHIKCSKRVEHRIIGIIADIYKKYQSNTCGDILLHLYKNAECTHCRCNIVEAMIINHVIPQKIIEECQYDSYAETRKLIESSFHMEPLKF